MNQLPVREKLAYGLGDLASGVVWVATSNFLMFFYTDVYGLGAVAAGTLVFIARSWDAVWDVFLGTRIDRTRSRWGQARPYILFGAPLFALAAIATFTVPNYDAQGKLVYAYVSYLALMMAYSLVNIPYSTLAPLMSDDPDDRTQLASVRMFFAFSAVLGIGAATMPLVAYFGAGDRAKGFQTTMVLFACIAVLLFWVCFAGVKERVPLAAKPSGKIGPDLKALATTRPWQVQFAVAIVTFTSFLLTNSVVIYYFNYLVGDPKAVSGYFLALGCGLLTGTVVSSRLTKLFCKRKVLICSKLLCAVFALVFYWVDPKQTVVLYGLAFVANLAVAVGIPIVWSMVADTADFAELQSGRRLAGLTTSTQAFATKFGLGIGGALSGVLLAWFGYKAGGGVQTPDTLHGIRIMMSFVPATGFLIVAALLTLYPLNRANLKQLKLDLQRARGAV